MPSPFPTSGFPTVGPTPNQLADLEPMAARIFNLATTVGGLTILVMLLVGAFQLLTAGSNQEQAQKARGVFMAAALGGAGFILVWLILQFIQGFTGVNVTHFSICIVDVDPITPGCQFN